MPWISGEAEEMWHTVLSPERAVRKRALSYWARNLALLPGPLFFTIPAAELLRGEWQRIVNNSLAQCPCGERRCFIPHASVDYFPHDEPPLFVLREGHRQVALGPWGGDTQSTFLQLSVAAGELHIRMLPYSGFSQADLKAAGFTTQRSTSEVVGDTLIRTSRPQDSSPLSDIAEQMKRMPAGEVAAVRSLLQVSEEKSIVCRMFAVYGIDLKENTLTVAPSRNCQVMDQANRSGFHICN